MWTSNINRVARTAVAAVACLVACSLHAAPLQSIHDAAGRLRFWIDANGAAATPQRIGYQRHDDQGRVVEEGWVQGRFDPTLLRRLAELPGEPSGAERTWRRRYFYAGDMAGATAPSPGALLAVHTRDEQGLVHMQSFRYDALGRVALLTESLGQDQPAMQTRYHRDAQGRVVRIDGPAAVNEADPDGLLVRHDGQGRVLAIGRHRQGVFEPEHYARYTWDNGGRLVAEVRNPQSAAGRLLLRYAHDAQGRLTSVRAWVGGRPAFTQSLQYDHRLIRAMRQDYLLEPGGPRSLQWRRGDAGLAPGTVASEDPRSERVVQLRGAEAVHAYAYDRNGNVLRKTGHLERVAIDHFLDLPVAIDTHDQQQMRMRYGGLQPERVWQASESGPAQARRQVTQAYYRGLEAYPLMIQSTARTAGDTGPPQRSRQRPVWGPGGLVAVEAEDASGRVDERFVIGNHQGSTMMVLDADGRPLASYAYSAAGRVSDPAGRPLRQPPLVPYLFQGQEYDQATGLHNYRARLYDSESLRFLAPDPVVLPGQPKYLAMNGDPVNWLDPDGRMMFQSSDFRTGVSRHMLGMAFSLAMTGYTWATYASYGVALAASFPVASTVVLGVTGGVVGAYGLYRFVKSVRVRGRKEFWEMVNAGGASVAGDTAEMLLLGQSPDLGELLRNGTTALAVYAMQLGGGKIAVAFNTPFRSDNFDFTGPHGRGGPGRAYMLAYVTNTVAMQPVNGAVLLLKKAVGRTNPTVADAQQLGWMAAHDAVGNFCYYACAAVKAATPGLLGREDPYRMKGCLYYYMACRAVTRGTESFWVSTGDDDMRYSATVPVMIFGALVDYCVGTHLMAKVPLENWHDFLTTSEVNPGCWGCLMEVGMAWQACGDFCDQCRF